MFHRLIIFHGELVRGSASSRTGTDSDRDRDARLGRSLRRYLEALQPAEEQLGKLK
jgi:hypothetical protein